jgi:hypothetical protein
LVVETLDTGESLGLLPWWYRVFYLHVAGMTFLAAMFVPELYTDTVAKSWRSVISALRDHQHLSVYVQQCIGTFETLSARILEPRRTKSEENTSAPFGESDFEFVFEDLLCDAGLDFDGFVFSTDVVAES